MLRSALVLICVSACVAQTPKPAPKPPAEVDKALRERIEQFFQYHVTGEFRKAEALVAEDTKDVYYNRNKPRYIKYVGIDHINYEEGFTKAYAVVMVMSPEMMEGWSGGPPTLPIPSTWKIENGKWCWYLDPDTFSRTPFGNIPMSAMQAAAQAGGTPSTLFQGAPAATAPPAAGGNTDIDPAALAAVAGARKLGMGNAAGIPGAIPSEMLDKIKPDRSDIALAVGKPAKITFANSAPDLRSLMLLGAMGGVAAKFDHTDVQPGQSAELTLEAGKDAKDGVLRIAIPQTGELITIRVFVK